MNTSDCIIAVFVTDFICLLVIAFLMKIYNIGVRNGRKQQAILEQQRRLQSEACCDKYYD